MVYDTIFYFCDIIKELVWKRHFYQVTKIMPSSMQIIFHVYFIFAAKFWVLGSNKWQGKYVEWIWSYKKCLSWIVSYVSSAPVLKRIKRYKHAVSVTNSDRTWNCEHPNKSLVQNCCWSAAYWTMYVIHVTFPYLLNRWLVLSKRYHNAELLSKNTFERRY